jgi:hypothetical protein
MEVMEILSTAMQSYFDYDNGSGEAEVEGLAI